MTARTTPGGARLANRGTPPPVRRDRLSLGDARSCLTTAEDALTGWYARQTTRTRCYVADGRAAIQFIGELLRELSRVRAALVAEIRADDDERGARIDRMLAEAHARRGGYGPTGEASGADAGAVRPGGAT